MLKFAKFCLCVFFRIVHNVFLYLNFRIKKVWFQIDRVFLLVQYLFTCLFFLVICYFIIICVFFVLVFVTLKKSMWPFVALQHHFIKLFRKGYGDKHYLLRNLNIQTISKSIRIIRVIVIKKWSSDNSRKFKSIRYKCIMQYVL